MALLNAVKIYEKKRPGFRCAEFHAFHSLHAFSREILRCFSLVFSLLNAGQIVQLVLSRTNEGYDMLVKIRRNDITTSLRYYLRMS